MAELGFERPRLPAPDNDAPELRQATGCTATGVKGQSVGTGDPADNKIRWGRLKGSDTLHTGGSQVVPSRILARGCTMLSAFASASSHFSVADGALVVAIVAGVAAVASAVWAWQSVREARRANTVPALVDFFREYRSYEPSRRYVLRDLKSLDPQLGVSELPDEARGHVVTVCHYLDQLGLLVDRRLVEAEAVAGLMGDSILLCWQSLAPYIRQERATRGRDYAAYFEALVESVWAIGPSAARRRLRRLPPSAQFTTPLASTADEPPEDAAPVT